MKTRRLLYIAPIIALTVLLSACPQNESNSTSNSDSNTADNSPTPSTSPLSDVSFNGNQFGTATPEATTVPTATP